MIWVWRFLEKLNNVVVEIFRQGRVRGTMVLRQCPFCHRPFEAEALAKEQVDSSEVTKVSDFPIETNRVTGQTMEGGFAIGRDLLFVLSEDERNIGQTRHFSALHPQYFRRTAFYRCILGVLSVEF